MKDYVDLENIDIEILIEDLFERSIDATAISMKLGAPFLGSCELARECFTSYMANLLEDKRNVL